MAAISDLLLDKYRNLVGESYANPEALESLIADSGSYYEEIIGSMPGNVYWLDKHAVGVGCNKNVWEMFGLQSSLQFKGLTFEDMARLGNWAPETIHAFKTDTLNVIKTGEAKLNIEEPLIPNQDGRLVCFLTNRVPLFDQKGNVMGVVGISIDITDRKEMEVELKKAKDSAELASQIKSEFIANMSHDVKTPLSGMISFAELLSFRVQPELHELLQGLMVSGKQLMSFFEDCIELSKIEDHSMVSSKESFSLKGLLRDIMQLFQPAIMAKGLCLYLDYADNMPGYVLGNRAHFYRVLLNLMGNAIKFTNKGFIRITVNLSQKSIERRPIIQLKILDTGIGIPEDKRQLIFEKFSRLTPSYQGSYEGHGIGLYIVQQFVEGMGGQIHVKSKEGKGSEFILAIPFESSLLTDEECDDEGDIDLNALQVLSEDSLNLLAALPLEETKELVQEGPTGNYQFYVLLVEDDLRAQMVVKALLESLGCHVDIADCGEKAITLFKPGKYSLVFMDIGLPDMKGYEISKCLREMEASTSSHVPILGLSAHASQEEKRLSADAGMQEMLSKPLLMNQAKKILADYVISESLALPD